MIVKTLISFTLFLSIWLIIVSSYPNLSATNGNYQANVFKAQQYIYEKSNTSIVITGSSLSHRIQLKNQEEIYNLSLIGMGPIDGLFVISKANTSPKYILIEINNFTRNINFAFQNNLFFPPTLLLKQKLNFLRADKQPLNHFVEYLATPFNKKILLRILGEQDYKVEAKKSKTPNQKMLQISVENYNNPIEKSVYQKNIKSMDSLIGILEARGSKIIFFEMPVNKKLMPLQKSYLAKEYIKKHFPKEKYTHIKLPKDSLSYITTDGVHLGPDEANRFSKYLENELIQLNILKGVSPLHSPK